MPKTEKPMTFAEWFAWMKDVYETNPHTHDWEMRAFDPNVTGGGLAPVFDPGNKRVFI